MYTGQIYECRISITKCTPQRIRKHKAKIPEYPAPLGDFTIGQLKQIFNEIEFHPYKSSHIFSFNGEKYLVRILSDDPDRQEDDAKKPTRWVG